MTDNLQFTIPHWRKGQTVFNFLEWLQTDKGYESNQNPRMADCFHITDDEFDKLWDEFQNTMQPYT